MYSFSCGALINRSLPDVPCTHFLHEKGGDLNFDILRSFSDFRGSLKVGRLIFHEFTFFYTALKCLGYAMVSTNKFLYGRE